MGDVPVGFCVSGRGRLFASVVRHRAALGVAPRLLFAGTPSAAGGLVRHCDEWGIPATVARTDTPAHLEQDLLAWFGGSGIRFAMLTFNRLVPPGVIARFGRPILSVHMSLLPAFKGFGALDAAIEAGVRVTGATIHEVTAETDGGPIVAQCVVPVETDDSTATLGRRVYDRLEPMFLQVVRWYAAGRATKDAQGRVWITGARYAPGPAFPVIEPEIAALAQTPA